MRTLSATELLDAWERGLEQRPVERALTLLAAASPGISPDTLTGLSIGRRDAGLLALRERMFGPSATGLADCPNCSERLELTFAVSEIEAPAASLPPESLTARGIRFRLPDSRDLLAVAGCADVAAARAILLRRCAIDRDADTLAEDDVEAVVGAMADADPQADVQLDLCCPACAHRWFAVFDIASFLWAEVNAWAQRTLQDVHRLALAYGWREPDILALTPWRRQVYLEMAEG
ncbi:MAG: hypothetical protein QOK37_3640 [Thermoanaerobaculia bacterium]|jgi:hypothetical protein|nr:hypothetical protein [Thermoanaerobaculia bacterium]